MDTTLANPFLFDSHLNSRIHLALDRLEHYPLDSMNFVMMDLERPPMRTRHAHWCTYDLTGRTLLFYAMADGIDGTHIARLSELYERIMNTRRPSGFFGNGFYLHEENADQSGYIGGHFITGLIKYYELSGDMRALSAAKQCGDNLVNNENYYRSLRYDNGANSMECWLTESFAELYRVTKEEKYLDAVRRITFTYVGHLDDSHAHGYLTTLRGIMRAALYSGDESLADFVKERRREIIDRNCIFANGDISEALPRSERNEGCAIADWIMLNLLYAQYFHDNDAYAAAEHSLFNALYFNQFVTGGFGHRYFSDVGYKPYVEEAWWCCTQNAGMCMTEVARHVVSKVGDRLQLNFLVPGEYTLEDARGTVRVTVTTGYPTKAEAIIRVTGTKEDLHIRIPECIRECVCRRFETPTGYEIHLNGEIGHTVTQCRDGAIVKFGPLVLAPMIYKWGESSGENRASTVPEGYTHESVKGSDYTLRPGIPDENGFYRLPHGDVPEWSVFEEGEMAKISGGETASAHIPLSFPDGQTKEMYFAPICSATSNLTLTDIPIVFRID